jgi:hypothetical protein
MRSCHQLPSIRSRCAPGCSTAVPGLYEKYLADKSLKPDRIDGIDVGKCDAMCVTEIVEAEHAERKELGFGERKWLTVVADEAHFMRNRAFMPSSRIALSRLSLASHLPLPVSKC